MKLSGESVVSRTMRRSAGVRRRRRGRVSGKDIALAETNKLLSGPPPDPDCRSEAPMRTLRRLAWLAILTVAPAAGAGGAAAATYVGEQGRVVRAPSGATVIRLSRLHHAAAREVQLGRLAELSASRPETRAYGARLTADF